MTNPHLTLPMVLQQAVAGQDLVWDQVPLACILEGLPQLRPRYYSISSSSLVRPDVASITVAVECRDVADRIDMFRGVSSNYLAALHDAASGGLSAEAGRLASRGATYQIAGPRNKYRGMRLPIHIRTSSFRLPSDPLTPLILIGAGTGVAPLRAFVQERAQLARNGVPCGKAMLFFGCRKSSQDFLYKAEWKVSGCC